MIEPMPVAELARLMGVERATQGKVWTPRSKLGLAVLHALPHLPLDLKEELLDAVQSAVVCESTLRVKVKRYLGLFHSGLIDYDDVEIEDYGIVSHKVVTNAGAGFIIDAFQNLTELEAMKYHGLGEDNTAEDVGDTALGDELTTEYAVDNVRATGTTAEFSTFVYQTVATNTLDSGTPGIEEHGIFDQASNAGGVLLDRSVFSVINLDGTVGDALETDYRFTITPGG